MANKHRKVWKVVSQKPFSRKQIQPKEKTFSWKLNQIFLWLESVFRWPESVFRWPTFLMANKHRKVWKVVSRKVNSRKQTWSGFSWEKEREKKLYIYILSLPISSPSWILATAHTMIAYTTTSHATFQDPISQSQNQKQPPSPFNRTS